MSEALIVRDDSNLAAFFTARAEEIKSAALEVAALIGRVSNQAEQTAAVNAQREIRTVLKQAEDARVSIKAPILDFGRKIDDAAKQFVAELKEEELRVAKLVGNYQTLELAKARAAEAARLKDLAEIERKKQLELAQAKSHEELDAIHARANEEAAAVPAVQHVKATGQIVKEEWEFDVTDVWLLARLHSNCVKIEPRRSEIKALLDTGIIPAGVTARKVVNSSVRLGREREALTV